MSIEVPDFADAVGRLDEELGLRVAVSPQAPDRHGRVYLDRAYLEVAANSGRRSWAVTSFFVRFSDPVGLRARLGGARLGYRRQVYQGVDGRWDDVELNVADVPVPILVRRTEPTHVARDWPPPLDEPQHCGAVTLVAVHLPVASIRRQPTSTRACSTSTLRMPSPAQDHSDGCFTSAPPRSARRER